VFKNLAMTLKGYCFFAEDCPEAGFPHVVVVISDENESKKSLLIPISSIKLLTTGKYKYKNIFCKYYDEACVFEGNEIVDEEGRSVLNRPSFARYQWALEISSKEMIIKQLSRIYQYRCKVTDAVLQSMQNGAKFSEELPLMVTKYFCLF
jgi:hypothetical protein